MKKVYLTPDFRVLRSEPDRNFLASPKGRASGEDMDDPDDSQNPF